MMETVSHSEVEQAGRCETAHLFNNGMEISPLYGSPPLQTGNAFHELAAAYYEAQGDGLDFDSAVDLAHEAGARYLVQNKCFAEYMDVAKETFGRYVDEADYFEWEVIAVEYYLEYAISDSVIQNGPVDLIVRVLRAPKEVLAKFPDIIGKMAIVDHKTCYNFWTKKEVLMHVQLPKYIFVANQSKVFGEEEIEYGIINMVRTRSDARQTVHREVVKPTLRKQVNVISEHLKVSEMIVERRQMTIDHWASIAKRTLCKDICKNCDYTNLCNLYLEGASPMEIQAEITHYFRPKDMRYREERKQRAIENAKKLELRK